MYEIYESFTDFCNEGENTLYKVTFSETWVNDEDKSQSPIWVLADSNQLKVMKKQPAIDKVIGFGVKKNDAEAEKFMLVQKEKKEDSSASSLTPLKKIGEIAKGLHKIAKVKESKVADAIMDLIDTWYEKPGDKKVLKDISGFTGVEVKDLEEILKTNDDSLEAFDAIMSN